MRNAVEDTRFCNARIEMTSRVFCVSSRGNDVIEVPPILCGICFREVGNSDIGVRGGLVLFETKWL